MTIHGTGGCLQQLNQANEIGAFGENRGKPLGWPLSHKRSEHRERKEPAVIQYVRKWEMNLQQPGGGQLEPPVPQKLCDFAQLFLNGHVTTVLGRDVEGVL